VTNTTPPLPQYVTVDEIAAELRLSRMTVYRMIHKGELPAARVGGRNFRVRTSDYDAYKAGLQEEAVARQTGAIVHIPGQTAIAE
jgi:excisionase family DNA binding protein